MCALPDSPEKRQLIEYLNQQIDVCNEQEYVHEGTSNEDFYMGKSSAYRDILDKIK